MKKFLFVLGVLGALVTFASCQSLGETYLVADEDDNKPIQEGIYSIPSDYLSRYGWDEGVISYSDGDDDFYFVMHEVVDEENHDMVTVCINGLEKDTLEDAMLIHFDDGNLLDIYLSGLLFVVESCTETGAMSFVGYNLDGEYVGEFDVPYETVNRVKTPASMSKSPVFNSKGEFSWPKIQAFMQNAEKVLNKVGNTLSTVYNASEGKFGDIALDILTGAVVGAVEGASWPIWLALTVEEASGVLVKNIYDCIVSSYLGHAQIEIESIKRTSSTTITVNGTLSDALSIPNYIHTSSGQEENLVFWGIAEGKSGQPGFYVNEHCSDLELISNNSFSYTFYAETNPGLVHYFRPFLIPKAKTPSEANPSSRIVSCIRYGERKEYLDMSVDLENFEQLDCKPVDENSYKAHFTIDGSIPGTFSELSNWGIDVAIKSDSYSQRFYAKEASEYYPPTENSFICEIPFDESDIVDYASERVVEITITPWISFWNQLPAFLFFDPFEYCITISDFGCPDDNHPHAIDLGLSVKWACCNVGASRPEEFGLHYAWGETETKSDYSPESYKWMDDWNLTKYNYFDELSVLEAADDVAHAKFGANWHMPTGAEWDELTDNCTWTWTDNYKGTGVAGKIVTSNKTGYTIFLPAAGGVYITGLDGIGSYGCYWLPSLHWDNYYLAFCVYFPSASCDDVAGDYQWRFVGLSVRPVSE